MDTIFLGKTFNQIIFVLPDTLNQITGHACVERAVASTCQNVNGWLHGLRLPKLQKRNVLTLNIQRQ